MVDFFPHPCPLNVSVKFPRVLSNFPPDQFISHFFSKKFIELLGCSIRYVFTGQHIDEEFTNQILATMLYLDFVDSCKRMYTYINDPCGDLKRCTIFEAHSKHGCMGIYDTMQSLKSPVGTRLLGYAYNLAGFLLAAGEKANDIYHKPNEFLRIRGYLWLSLNFVIFF
ncbi:ATP-dependent Clp protease proteolytic subunit-related protein 2, chloroplastic-like isoform X2 [Cornus florida]|uniref:ATP-dependent Clp protease proteolytic subunit-related protein 2, chloroplastic-like isoform X2 n=1 Tax=Cornus florida TaxID=4283 RepID=UPI0028964EF7|nr:ATP-dependent Clp protease proteolytic subunit-related protein 2, chloroplastic-like isoform X2 [Cornus florida]